MTLNLPREIWMASRDGLRQPRGGLTATQKSAEGRKFGKEEPLNESPNGIRKDLKAGKRRTLSHD